MNKAELLSAIAKKTGLAKDQINNVLNAYGDIVIEQVLKDKEFTVLNWGKIKVFRRSERKALNPRTKEPVLIPACDALKFSFSRSLKQKVAEQGEQ